MTIENSDAFANILHQGWLRKRSYNNNWDENLYASVIPTKRHRMGNTNKQEFSNDSKTSEVLSAINRSPISNMSNALKNTIGNFENSKRCKKNIFEQLDNKSLQLESANKIKFVSNEDTNNSADVIQISSIQNSKNNTTTCSEAIVNKYQFVLFALNNKNFSKFLASLKEEIEQNIASDLISKVIDAVMKQDALHVMSEICTILKNKSQYSRALSRSFIKHHDRMMPYKENVLDCLLSMSKSDLDETIENFTEACYCVKDWNKMWSGVNKKDSSYKLKEKYFNECIDIFRNPKNHSDSVAHDTLLIIVPYIMKHYSKNHEEYIADIWLYSIITIVVNSQSDLKIPGQILDRVIDKIVLMSDVSTTLVMNLLYQNMHIIGKRAFRQWLSHIIVEKTNKEDLLLTIKELIKFNSSQDLNQSFLLLVFDVMSNLNQKQLFVCSKCVYEMFLSNNIVNLKILFSLNNALKYKCEIVESLIGSNEYGKALHFVQEFRILEHSLSDSDEYYKLKEMLPNLFRNSLKLSINFEIIDMFKRFVSVFVHNQNIGSLYSRNCNDIFDSLIIQAYESHDKELIRQAVLLVNYILTEIKFTISKERLRALLVGGVQADIPFNELQVLTNLYFEFEIFPKFETSKDCLGTCIKITSNLFHEEVNVLITSLCRHIKLKLLQLSQNKGSSIRENLMKSCFLKFILCPSKLDSVNSLEKFTAMLSAPKYLSRPITHSVSNNALNEIEITCDNKTVYSSLYYSEI